MTNGTHVHIETFCTWNTTYTKLTYKKNEL
jgi:hypothetical protein